MKSVNTALFSVVRLEAFESEVGITKNLPVARATGFFYENSSRQKYLVTNKHLVYNPKDAYRPDFLVAHVRTKLEAPGKTKEIRSELYKDGRKMWNALADRRVDIAAVKIDESEIKGCPVGYFSNKDLLPVGQFVALGSSAIVLGFPKGELYDEFSNFPVARFATITTLPFLAFNKRRCFLVDAKLPEGMSGSPVVSMPRSIYEQDGKPVYDDVNCYLLGIFSSEWLWGDEPLGLNTVWYPELIEEAAQERD